MGCDIHMFCEVRKFSEGNVPSCWKHTSKIEKVKYEQMEFEEDIYVVNNRHYCLFALLADVRNGMGFAGIDTGDRIDPIASPRGLPKDISSKVRKEADIWEGDGHSYSYFTLKELLNYDFNKEIVQRGWVTANGYSNYIKTGYPNSWCADINGQSIKKVSQNKMNNIIKKKLDYTNYYTQIQWTTPYKEEFESFLSLMERLKKLGNPKDVRLVFWFDN